ncbi:MAG: type I 3-dehydroquinate dehydratase, partial [Candidatus Acidiferrales bacterium]
MMRAAGRISGEDRICAVAAAEDARELWQQLRRALQFTSTVELRLDWLRDDREIGRFLHWRALKAPRATLIATCRRLVAGGRYRGTVAAQLIQLAEAVSAGCAWYDLEIETAALCPPELLDVLLGEGRQIASAHYFQRMPRKLKRVAAELARGRPDAIKISARCRSLAEGLRLLQVARGRRDVIAIPMGEVVMPLRVLGLREGSALTYAPVKYGTAPGQLSLDAMTKLYRAGQVTKRTRVYGVIGDPVSHSLSPVLQNAGFQARGMDAVYLPFLVHDLRDFLGAVGPLGIAG